MDGSPEDSFSQALAAARAGNRVTARNLLSRLLRSDSSSVDYWLWMSSVVHSKKDKLYCLESALKIDPNNPAVLRGLTILGARVPKKKELAAAGKLSRRHMPSISAGQAVGQAMKLPWRMIAMGAAGVGGVIILAVGVRALAPLFGPRTFSQAPTLPPPSLTPSATPPPTATNTAIPANLRVLRTAIPTEFALTPLVYFVPQTPTPTLIAGMTPHPQYEAYAAGIEAIMQGEYAEAVGFFDQVIQFNGSLPDPHYFKGEALRLMAQAEGGDQTGTVLGQAINAYDRAIVIDGEFAPAYLGRGRALLARTLLRVAPQDLRAEDLPSDFSRAFEVDPGFIEAYVEHADYLARVTLWKTMEESLQAALDRGLRDPILYVRIAEAQINRQKYELALENAIEGSGADDSMLDGYRVLGRALVRLENYPAALDPLLTYVAYRGDDHRGWSDLGRAQLEIGDLVNASNSIARALEINPRYAPAFISRGWLNIKVGAYQTALDDFNEARRFGQENYELFMGLGYAHYYLQNWQQGLNHANTAIDIGLQDQRAVMQHKLVSRGYALRALISESAPDLLDYAINNWTWILELQFADPVMVDLAVEHLTNLTGEAPTRAPTTTQTTTTTPTVTPFGTLPVTPSATPAVSHTPSRTPTPTISPTPSPSPSITPTPSTPTLTPTPTNQST